MLPVTLNLKGSSSDKSSLVRSVTAGFDVALGEEVLPPMILAGGALGMAPGAASSLRVLKNDWHCKVNHRRLFLPGHGSSPVSSARPVEDLQEFITRYNPKNRHKRKEAWNEQSNPEGRWRKFGYE